MIAGLALLFAPGCAARSPDLAAPYREVHQDWTQELRLSHSFELDLLLRATLLSPPLLEAQADYLAAARLSDRERAAEALPISPTDPGEYVVVFASYSPVDEARGFSGDGGEAWTLHLDVDGSPQPLLSVEELRHPSAELLALYPQRDRWSSLWIARFERLDEGREIRLTVSGVYGRGSVRWPG